MLQIGRSLARFQLVSLEFFIDIISFRSQYGPGVESASNRNEYQKYFLGVKAAGNVKLTTLLLSCAVVMKSGNLKFLEPSGPLQACNGTLLPFKTFTLFGGVLKSESHSLCHGVLSHHNVPTNYALHRNCICLRFLTSKGLISNLGFHRGVADDSVRLRYRAASLTNRSPTFRRIILPKFSRV